MRRRPGPARPGLTVAEAVTLAVIFLVGLGLLLALLPRIREQASKAQCASHLKAMAEAMHHFDKKFGRLPASRIDDGYATWAVLILPFLPVTDQHPGRTWDLQRT